MTSCFICIEHFSFRFLFFSKTIIHFFSFFSNFGSYGNCLLFLFLFLISFYIFVLILYALYHSFQVLFFNNHLLLTHYSLELFKVSVIHYIKGIFVLDASFGGMIRSNLYPMLPSISRCFSHHSLSTRSRDMCHYDQQGIYIVFSELLVLKQVK